MDFVGFLSMVIYAILYTQCLRYNICSTSFLDIRISTCELNILELNIQYSDFSLQARHTWFLKIDPVRIVSMHVCVCPRPRLLITSGMMLRDMKPI